MVKTALKSVAWFKRNSIEFAIFLSAGVCDYGGHCLALAQTIRKSTPDAIVVCKRGRQGSFEVEVNEKKIYSKLRTMALPDYEEVATVVSDVSKGSEPREIKRQQPIDCAIT